MLNADFDFELASKMTQELSLVAGNKTPNYLHKEIMLYNLLQFMT